MASSILPYAAGGDLTRYTEENREREPGNRSHCGWEAAVSRKSEGKPPSGARPGRLGESHAPQVWGQKQPPENARCARCQSPEISSLPGFSVGSGIAVRPVAEDVYCRRCGSIGVPIL